MAAERNREQLRERDGRTQTSTFCFEKTDSHPSRANIQQIRNKYSDIVKIFSSQSSEKALTKNIKVLLNVCTKVSQ